MKKYAKVLTIFVVIAVVVGMKMHGKSKASAEVREQALSFVASAPGYSASKESYVDLFAEYHSDAFNQAYSMGGRYSSATFDWKNYKAFLLALMAREAKSEGKEQIASELTAFSKAEGLPEVVFDE
jgi:hypothetical protein